jgi:class 3 adenylate cyclase/tetratricopeptide (TPR) repeat protein
MGVVACVTCSHPVPEGARFCPSCGTPVAKTDALEERRVVTVLFADLVGYTSLAEHLDPERVKRLVDTCFERLVADIEAFGGRVDKLLGDAIVALFGAPVAHEDDAERAARAALRMQETLSRVVAETGLDEPIRMRIGLNTGEVLVGILAGSDYTAMGDVVNTASRLQALAPPGGVLAGSATIALCPPTIRCEPFGVTRLRGRDQDEQAWLITGADAAGTRPLRCDVPFIGRVHERAVLDAAVQLVRSGHGGVVSIIGEAGSGKSRLADEVVAPLEGEAIVVRTACAPYGDLNVWAPIITGLATLLGVDIDATPDELAAAITARAEDLWGLQPDDPALGRYLDAAAHLLGHPSSLDRLDAAGARDAVQVTLTDMVRRQAMRRLTVVVVDNLHWADQSLRDQLGVIVRTLADLPFLLITTQRPDGSIAWPPPVERPLVLQVPLGPLSRADATALVSAVLEQSGHEHTERVVADIVARGGGNPLFLVELAALAATCSDELPGTLRALIAARLDQLPAPQRAMIDNAAVLGTADSIGSLVRFALAMGQEFRQVDLEELVAAGLFDVEGKWWRFRSAVVRDVAYQTLTKRVRAQRHAGVAAVMADRGAPIDDVAHHAATAAELLAELGHVDGVSPTIGAQAVQALREAASAAVETGRYETAARHASRALDLHPPDPTVVRALLLIRSQAELERRNFAQASADATEVLAGALADGDVIHEGGARQRLGVVAQMQGDLATARRELDLAVELFRTAGDLAHLAGAVRARGFAEVFGGSLDDGRRLLGEAMELYRQLDDERGHAWTQQNLAWVSFQSGQFDEAEVQLRKARAHFDKLGDANGLLWADGLRAWVCYFQRRFDEAEALATAVEGDARRRADRWARLMMQTLLANLRLWTGRLAEAEQLADRALAGFRELNDRYGIMQALGPLNRARAGLGKKADAKRGVEEAIALGKTFGELGLALQGAAGVAMHLGAGEQALTLAEQVIERHEETGTNQNEAHVLMALARCQLGQVDEAMAAIEHVRVEDFPFGLGARALVRALAGDVQQALVDAAEVETTRGASYFDLALGRLAGVLAAGRGGDETASRHWLDQLGALASSVGDVVLVAIAQLLAERPSAGGDGAADASSLAPGWRRIVDAVVAA